MALAACSTTEGANTDSSGKAKAATGAAKETLDAGYKGVYEKPTATGPKAVTAKNVWVISCGQLYPLCAQEADETLKAAKVLGWKSTLQDGKANASTASNAIKQALAAKADGIIIYGFDCPGIKAALNSAKADNVPVVSAEGVDCDDPIYHSGAPLYTASTNIMGSSSGADFPKKMGTESAKYIAAKLGGAGKVIYLNETSYAVSKYQNDGFAEEMKKSCPKCKVVNVPWTFAQVGTSASQTWNSALLKNPDADALAFPYDAMMGLGLQTALQQAHFKGIVAGTQGQNLDLVRSGVQTQDTASFNLILGWSTADTLNRLFAGEKASSLPTEGGGIIFVDKDHNLQSSGKDYSKIPFDYVALYTKMWTGN